MKIILSIILVLFCLNTFSMELTSGSIVNYHYLNNFTKLNNTLTDNGRYVISPYYFNLKYKSFSVFTSRDCLNLPIFGAIYQKSIFNTEKFKTELTFGLYFINEGQWKKSTQQYWFKYGAVPLIGAVNTFDLYKHNNLSIEVKNSIFPSIIQNGIFLKIEF